MLRLRLLVLHRAGRLNRSRGGLAHRSGDVRAMLGTARRHLANACRLSGGGGGTLLSNGGCNAGGGRTRHLSIGHVVEASGDNGDTNLIAESIVDDITKDDVRLGVRGLTHKLRGCEDFLEAEVRATLEEHEDAMRTVDRSFEQRRGDRTFDGAQSTIFTGRGANTHESRTRILHDGLDIVEVHVNETRSRNQLSDALNARQENLVGSTEGIENGDVRVGDFQKTVVRDDDQGVDLFAQGRDTTLGLSRTAVTLEGEGAGHDTDGQGTRVASNLGNNRGRTRTRATALTGGHENHVRALKRSSDFLDVVLGGLAADMGVGIGVFIDEMQDLGPADVSALCAACHEISQQRLPLIVIGAGLPHLPALLSASKSYSERLFSYQNIDRLDRAEADKALQVPAQDEDADWGPDALAAMYEATGGYPYFIQAYGKAVWDVAASSPISADDVRVGTPEAEGELAVGFFGSRFERATPAERDYLRTMAELSTDDAEVSSSEVAARLGRKPQSLSPARDALMKKGLIYSGERGKIAFTVPHFGRYLRRQP